MTQRSNVLARRSRPTKKSYREAVKEIVLKLQADYSLNDPELADRLGCSAPTIANARNEKTNLDGVTLANIEYEFGPSALDPFLELGGSRSVPIGAVCNSDAQDSLLLLDALRVVIEAERDDSPGGKEKLQVELETHAFTLRRARTTLDRLIAIAEGKVAA